MRCSMRVAEVMVLGSSSQMPSPRSSSSHHRHCLPDPPNEKGLKMYHLLMRRNTSSLIIPTLIPLHPVLHPLNLSQVTIQFKIILYFIAFNLSNTQTVIIAHFDTPLNHSFQIHARTYCHLKGCLSYSMQFTKRSFKVE